MPREKFRVPSIGSTTQSAPPGAGVVALSSASTGTPGVASARRRTISSSARWSARVAKIARPFLQATALTSSTAISPPTSRAMRTPRCARDAKRHGTVPLEPTGDELDDPHPEPPHRGPSVEEIAEGTELLAHVEQALESVPIEQRTAVLLRDVQGFDYEEIARITNTELGTVKSRIHRGRLAVRDHLIARGWRPGNPSGPRGVGD